MGFGVAGWQVGWLEAGLIRPAGWQLGWLAGWLGWPGWLAAGLAGLPWLAASWAGWLVARWLTMCVYLKQTVLDTAHGQLCGSQAATKTRPQPPVTYERLVQRYFEDEHPQAQALFGEYFSVPRPRLHIKV